MSGMRHLRVPSEATARWRDRLLAAGWLAAGVGIQADGDHRLVPLTDAAPEAGSSWYEGHATVERSSLERGPQHWRERLDDAVLEQIDPSFRPHMKFRVTSCWSNLNPRPSPMSKPSPRPCSISSPTSASFVWTGASRAVSRSRPPCCLVEGRQPKHRHERQRTRTCVHARPEHGLLQRTPQWGATSGHGPHRSAQDTPWSSPRGARSVCRRRAEPGLRSPMAR